MTNHQIVFLRDGDKVQAKLSGCGFDAKANVRHAGGNKSGHCCVGEFFF